MILIKPGAIFQGSGILKSAVTCQDEAGYIVYRFAMEAGVSPNVMRVCDHCGSYLRARHCGDHLYMVWCEHCGIVALTTAKTEDEAACKTLGS